MPFARAASRQSWTTGHCRPKRETLNGPTIVGEASTTVRAAPADVRHSPFTITGDRLVFGSPAAGPARWFLEFFEGSFHCEPTEDGIRATHREAFGFRRLWRRLAHPLLRRWLEADTAVEMARVEAMLDADPTDRTSNPRADR
jgi:hypothetical protein